MTKALFLRVGANDKEHEIAQIIRGIRDNSHSAGHTFLVEPSSFQLVPNAAFAYWVSDPIRALFEKLPPFERAGLAARAGLCTGDDFRFVRLTWEVRDIDHANDQTRWVPFAKGGAFGRYYSDIHLLVNWHDSGKEIVVGAATGTIPGARPQNVSYFFQPGVTWPLRTTSEFGVRAMPAGCISGHKGPAAYAAPFSDDTLLAFLAVCNSLAFKGLLSLQLAAVAAAARSYEVGVVQRTVVPQLDLEHTTLLAQLARTAWESQRLPDIAVETSHAFLAPVLVSAKDSLKEAMRRSSLIEAERTMSLASIQEKVDDLVYRLYGIAQQDRREFELMLFKGSEEVTLTQDRDQEEEEDSPSDTTQGKSLVEHLISYLLGVVFGRWDIRYAIGGVATAALPNPFEPLPVCPPGMLQNSTCSPAESGNLDATYPISIPWYGALLDDPDHPLDIVRRVRQVIDIIWKDHADAIEGQACEILGVSSLRDYFRKPSGFFAGHLKRYSKSRRQAPIFWPLSTATGSYTVWLYYQRFNKDTLYKALEHSKEKIIHEEQQQAHLLAEAGSSPSADWRKTLTAQAEFVAELRSFYEELARVVPLWNPDLDDGVIINYSLLWRMVPYKPWQKTVKACWDELAAGKHDWAGLAMHLWPDRVVPKCAMDRSLAIAHGLEGIFWAEGAEGKWAARAIPLKPIDSIIQERSSPAVSTALRGFIEPQTVSGNSRISGRRKATPTGNRN